jgi:hypothetical protein
MKKGFLIVVILSLTLFSTFAQENPWLPKGETPWGEYEKTEKSTVENEPKKENQPIDEPLKTNENLSLDTLPKSENQLYQQAVTDVSTAYKSRNEFILGCAFGIIFATGVIPSLLVVATDNKQEKKLIKEIESRPEYQPLNNEKLNKKLKKSIKGRKFAATMGGVAVGIGAKLLTLYLIMSN